MWHSVGIFFAVIGGFGCLLIVVVVLGSIAFDRLDDRKQRKDIARWNKEYERDRAAGKYDLKPPDDPGYRDHGYHG